MTSSTNDLLVQVASYNTNLQGNYGLPQDLVDWLAPTLTVSTFLSQEKRPADIIAVGFQELLPLHFGLCGLSRKVIESRDALIRSQLEAHAPGKERYTLVAKVVNVGIALLVYIRDEALGSRLQDVQTQWTGCGPCWMGNKGAVGIRFRLNGVDGGIGETFTFVNAHLTAFEGKLANRIADYQHIVNSLLFPPLPSTDSNSWTNMYSTSHLFFVGDLNFRLSFPQTHPFASKSARPELIECLRQDFEREKLKDYDELYVERQKGNVFVSLREGDFWKFKCTYKYQLKEVDKYMDSRLPAWTDRVMYTTYSDSPETPDASAIKPVLYTSIPSYTTSDHKPIVAVLLVPTGIHTATSEAGGQIPERIPKISLPASFSVPSDRFWMMKRLLGQSVGHLAGYTWTLLWYIGIGNAPIGIINFLLGLVAWKWWAGAGSISLPDPDV